MNDRVEPDSSNKLMSMMNKIMPTCKEVSHLTSSSMDEKLTFRQKLGVRFHLMFCKWCRLFRSQVMQMRAVIKSQSLAIQTGLEEPDFKLSAEFKNRLKKSLENND